MENQWKCLLLILCIVIGMVPAMTFGAGVSGEEEIPDVELGVVPNPWASFRVDYDANGGTVTDSERYGGRSL